MQVERRQVALPAQGGLPPRGKAIRMDDAYLTHTVQLVVFTLDGDRYALHLAAVERVLAAAELTHVPQAPAVVLGVLDVAGRVVPVVDLRQRFGLPAREIEPSDRLIVAYAAARPLALPADSVAGVIEVSQDQVTGGKTVFPGLDYVQGILRLDDGLVVIHDLDTFLSFDEARTLDEALHAHEGER